MLFYTNSIGSESGEKGCQPIGVMLSSTYVPFVLRAELQEAPSCIINLFRFSLLKVAKRGKILSRHLSTFIFPNSFSQKRRGPLWLPKNSPKNIHPLFCTSLVSTQVILNSSFAWIMRQCKTINFWNLYLLFSLPITIYGWHQWPRFYQSKRLAYIDQLSMSDILEQNLSVFLCSLHSE